MKTLEDLYREEIERINSISLKILDDYFFGSKEKATKPKDEKPEPKPAK